MGASIDLYAIGRYVVPPNPDQPLVEGASPRTNRWSVIERRLHENVHFLSDVLMGSASGTATGWTVVGRHGRSSYALAPVPVRGGLAMHISRVT